VATQARRFDVEPALVRERNVWAGVRLWTGGMAFLFVSFLFAFLYLRSLNNDQMWRPKGVNPPVVFGSIVLVCVVLSVIAYALAMRALPAQGEGGWRRLAMVTVVLLLAAVVVQSIAWYHLGGYGPKDGGYIAVMYGWTGFYSAALFGTIYWLWTQIAQSLRGSRLVTAEGGKSIQLADKEAVAFFLYFLLGIEIVLYVLLYLIA
jgi:heme/copper-type cytochrome/quinol oxidase subunit 3